MGMGMGMGAAWAQQSALVDLPDSIAAPGATVKWVKKVAAYCEGPAVDAQGNLYFTQQKGSDWPIWKIDPANPADTGKIWGPPGFQSNGLAFDSQGRMYAAQKGKVSRYTLDGKIDSTLATSGQGANFGQANDLTLAADGSFYFTDLAAQVFHVDAKGKLSVAGSSFKGANGIEYLEEEKAVYVFEYNKSQITRNDIAADGSLTNPRPFIQATAPDGADIDSHGNWYVGSYETGTVFVFNAKAEQIGKIAFKQTAGQMYDATAGDRGNICNCHFGGAANKTLYCTGDGGAYSIDLKIAGRKPLFAAGVRTAWIAPMAKPAVLSGIFRLDGRGIPSRSTPMFRAPITLHR